jgi:hypothetical protein
MTTPGGTPGQQVTAATEFLRAKGQRLTDIQGQVATTNTAMFADAVPLVSGRWTGFAARTAAQLVASLEAAGKELADLLGVYAPAVIQAAAGMDNQEETTVAALRQVAGSAPSSIATINR